MAAKTSVVTIEYGKFNGGNNTIDEPSEIESNQVQDSINARFTTKGTRRRKGVAGVTNTLPTHVRQLASYLQEDGTEIKCLITKLYR